MTNRLTSQPGYSGTRNVEPPSLDSVLDLLLDAVCLVDAEGRFVFASAACERIFGYGPGELIGRRMQDMIHPDDLDRTLEAAGEVLEGRQLTHFENRYLRKDSDVVHVMWSARWSDADRLRIAVARDITERRRADAIQDALYAISEAAYAAEDLVALFGHVHRIIGGLLPAANFFVALYDQADDQLTFPYYVDQRGQPPSDQSLNARSLSAEVIRTGKPLQVSPDAEPPLGGERWLDLGPGALHWLGVPLTASGSIIGVLGVQTYDKEVAYSEKDRELLQFVSTQVASVIERKRLERRLHYAALYDQLTDLPNRVLFYDRLQNALTLVRRDQMRLSLLYLDLDSFKQVNDTHGHAMGDLLLQEVARRLRACVRESDTVCRFGGDEFLVLLSGIDFPGDALMVAEKVRASLNEPYDLAGFRLRTSASIGIAACPDHGDEERALIHAADGAMYQAKKLGGNRTERVKPSAGKPAPVSRR